MKYFPKTHMHTRLETIGALAFALIAVSVSSTAVLHSFTPTDEVPLIPTIGGGHSFLGQSIPSQTVEINDYSPEQAAEGVTLFADQHNFFSCRTGGITNVTTESTSAGVRFWVYEFTGNEPPFNGHFFVSSKELTENPRLGGLPRFEQISELKRYYVMTEQDLLFTCGEPISTTEFCGDNTCQENENASTCIADCNVCGDGYVYGDEECDNSLDEPGCSDSCTVEVGYSCEGEPSSCRLLIPTLPGQGGSTSSHSGGIDDATCNDTDGGNDSFTKGTATLYGQFNTDFCSTATTLNEYSCEFGIMEVQTYNCAFGCSDGACARQSDDGGGGSLPSSRATSSSNNENTGSLFITKDSTPLRHRQLLGGTLGDAILRLELHAEGEDIDVTDIQLSANTHVSSIDGLDLYREGDSEPFTQATIGGCGSDAKPSTTTFCVNMENRQLVIPSGEMVDVIVRPLMKTDSQGGISGELFSIGIDGEAIATFNAGGVRARGATSSNDLVANNGDSTANGEIFIGTSTPGTNSSIAGNTSQSVHAKITSITNGSPDPDGAAVPTGVSPIGQFRFSAANHTNSQNGSNDVVLKTLRFDVNGTNVAINARSFKLYNKADASIKHSCQPFYIGGEPFTSDGGIMGMYTVLCTGIDGSSINSEIDEGDDTIFVLEANITSPRVGNSTSVLQVNLKKFSQYDTDNDNIVWSDVDQNTNQTFNWVEYPETTVKSTTYSS